MNKDYSLMNPAVMVDIPTLIIVPPRPPQPPPRVKASKAMKRGALKALDAIEELFGPKGKHWVQRKYYDIKDGFESFCLSGGFNKIDGAHEALARAAVSVAIWELFPERTEKDYYDDEVTPATVANESTITLFNDNSNTSWGDVKKVLKRARELLS